MWNRISTENLARASAIHPKRTILVWTAALFTAMFLIVALFKDATRVGMLSPGDPIRLLWDIEQAYPAMSA